MSQVQEYVPVWSIKINGKTLLDLSGTDPDRDIQFDMLAVSVTDTIERADSFSFHVTARGARSQQGQFASGDQLQWMDGQIFKEGSEVAIEMGYGDDAAFRFLGEITAVSPQFSENQPPFLIVRGFSLYHRLQRRRRREPFVNITDSDIARELAKAVGLQAEVDETDIKNLLFSPANATFDAILRERAARLNYEVTVKQKILYFQQPRYLKQASPLLTLEWGSALRSFNLNLSTYNMPTEVVVEGSQTARGGKKQLVVGQAKAGQERGKLGTQTGPQLAERIFGKNAILWNDHNISNQQEAQKLAQAQLEAKALDFITGRGSCVGNPKLSARNVIELKGLGKRFSGNYYLTSVTHTIDAHGYRTDFEVKRNASNGA